jgi:hypothetical protein
MCSTRFDPQEQKRLIMKNYLSYQEIAAASESNETRDEAFDPISDTEEDDILPQDRESLPRTFTTTHDLEGIEAMDQNRYSFPGLLRSIDTGELSNMFRLYLAGSEGRINEFTISKFKHGKIFSKEIAS